MVTSKIVEREKTISAKKYLTEFRSHFTTDCMECRPDCGACCIAPSISSPIVGMPLGKPAGVTCAHLSTDYRCQLYADSRRPKVCAQFQASRDVCGVSQAEALQLLAELEALTQN